MDQIDSVKDSLESLTIMLEATGDEPALEWSIENMVSPKVSLRHFTALKHLAVLQAFVCDFDMEQDWESVSCMPEDLPQTLETLEIMYPDVLIHEWAEGLRRGRCGKEDILPKFRKLTLTCGEGVGMSAKCFENELPGIWAELSDDGIEAYVFCQTRQIRQNLADLHAKQFLSDSDGESDGKGGSDSDMDMLD